MPEEVNQTELVSDGLKAKVKEQQDMLSNTFIVEAYQQKLPKYAGMNPHHLNNRLLNDSEFFDEFTYSVTNIEELGFGELSDEAKAQQVGAFKRGLRTALTQKSTQGVDVAETIVNRSMGQVSEPSQLPLKEFKGIIQDNPERYSQFGVVNEDGVLAYEDNKVLGRFVAQNDDLKKTLYSDRFSRFEDEVDKTHNPNALVASDPDQIAKAYAVYDSFGSEGLTQYFNYQQFKGNPDTSSTMQMVNALQFVNNAKSGDKGLDQVITDFIGEDEEDRLTFNPPTDNYDVRNLIPKDLNDFSSLAYNVNDEGNITQRSDSEFLGMIKDKFFPEEFEGDFNAESFSEDGEFSDEYATTMWGISRAIEEGDVSFDHRDLMRTVIANHDRMKKIGGDDAYVVDYNQADAKTKVAINVLRNHPQYEFLLRTNPQGEITIDPDRRDRAMWIKRNLMTDKKIVQNENGDLVVQEEIDKSVWGQTYNSMATLTQGLALEVGKLVGEPVSRLMKNMASDFAPDSVVTEGLDNVHQWLETNTGVDTGEMMDWDEYGKVAGTVGNVVPFLAYLGGMYGIGKGALVVGAKFLKGATSLKVAQDLNRYGRVLQGTNTWARRGNKLSQAIKNGDDWVMGFGMFETGAGIIEATQPEKRSMFNTLPQMVTGKNANAMSEFYQKSSTGLQTAMDFGGSVMFGMMADTMIRTLPFATGLTAKALGKKDSFKSIVFDADNGRYLTQSTPQLRTEHRMFYENFMKELGGFADGNATQSARNAYFGRAFMKADGSAETLADFSKVFVDRAGKFARGIREDIEEQVRFYETNHASKYADEFRLSDSEVKTIVDEQYNGFINSTAQRIRSVFANPDAVDPDQLTLRFADQLADTAPTTRKVTEVKGRPAHISDLNQLRKDGRNVVAVGDEIFEVDGHHWAVDLSEELRHLARVDSKQKLVDSKLNKQFDGSVDRQSPEVLAQKEAYEREVDAYFGVPVKDKNGNLGYIVDRTDEGYTVRTDNGLTTEGTRVEVGDEQLDKLVDEAGRVKISRENAEEIRANNPETGESFTMVDPDDIEEVKLGSIESAQNEASKQLDSATRKETRLLKEIEDNKKLSDPEEVAQKNQALEIELDEARQTIRLAEEQITEAGRLKKLGNAPRKTPDGQHVDYTIRDRNGTPVSLNEKVKKNQRSANQSSKIANQVDKARKSADEKKKLIDENQPKDTPIDVDDAGGGAKYMPKSAWDSLSKKAGRTIKKTVTNARNIFRNLGLFDERWRNAFYSTNSGNMKRLLGKNKADITEWNPKAGKVGSNVMVKRTSPSGRVNYFLSNKATEMEPSRIVDNNGRPSINPDWDAMDKNITISSDGTPTVFKRTKDGTYRPIKDDETGGVFLNIQNLHRGSDLSNSKIIELEVDAIQVGPKEYRLVDETNQVFGPEKIDTPVERRALDVQTKKGEVDLDEAQLKVEEGGFADSAIARAVAGSLIGGMFDDSDDWEGAMFGGALALFLGAPSVRSKIVGTFKRGSFRSKDAFDEFKGQAYKDEKLKERAQKLARDGYSGKPDDVEDMNRFEEQMKPLNRVKALGKSMKDTWKTFQSLAIFESGYRHFNMNSPIGKKFGKTIEDWGGASAKMQRRIVDRLRESVEKVDAPEELKELIREGDFSNASIQAMKRAVDDTMDDAEAVEEFGRALFRIISYGSELDSNGAFRFDSKMTPAVEDYKSQAVRSIDSKLLQDDFSKAVIDGVRDGFDDVGKRNIRILNQKADDLFVELGNSRPNQTGLDALGSYLDSADGISFTQFKNTLDPTKKKALVKLIENNREMANDILRLKESVTNIESLQGRYIPQIKDMNKQRQRFIEFSAKHTDKGWSGDTMYRRFDEHENRRILAKNKEKFDLLEVDINNMDVSSRVFKTKKEASKELERILRASSATMDENELALARSFLDGGANGIEEAVRRVQIKGKTHFILTTPKKWKDVFDASMFEAKNLAELASISEKQTFQAVTKRSHFIESPRKNIMPLDMINTNLDNVIERYSYDAGRRMYAIENNMMSKRDVNKNWFAKIDKELRENSGLKGEALDAEVRNSLQRTEEWYKIGAKIHDTEINSSGMTPKEIADAWAKKEKREANTLRFRKLGTMPFLYFTTAYSWATPALFGSFMSSGKSIASSYKMMFSDPKAMKSWADEIVRNGVLPKKLHAHRPEHQRMGREITDMENEGGAIARLIDAGAEKSATMSVMNPIFKAIGIDHKNTGALRLLTGNMFDISGYETALTIRSAFTEVSKLSKQGERLLDKSVDATTELADGRSLAKIRRRLTEMGVEDPDRFMRMNNKLDNYIESIDANKPLQLDDIDDWLYDQTTKIMTTTTDKYHGRTIMSRPTKWLDNPVGRVLTTFSVYAQNFGQQTVLNSIYRPVKNFHAKWGQESDMSAFKLHWYMNRGNKDKLKGVFGDDWQQAYNDYPVEVYDNVFKAMSAIGIGKVMMISRGAMLDTIDLGVNQVVDNPDEERWRNVNRQWTVNPRDPKDQQFTFGELFDDSRESADILKAIMSTGTLMNDLGFFTRLPQALQQQYRFPQGGITSVTPTGGIIQEFFDTGRNITESFFNGNMGEFAATTAEEVMDLGLFMTPGLGTFYDARKSVIDSIFSDTASKSNVSLMNSATGSRIGGNNVGPTIYY